MERKILTGSLCPYCHCKSELVSDKEIYGPNSTYGGLYYRCINNYDHYVGCHEGTQTSLGRIADKRLRELKRSGHELFDPLWRNKPKVFSSRQKAYYWFSKHMGITDRKLTHFGMFDETQSLKAIAIINEFKASFANQSTHRHRSKLTSVFQKSYER